MSVVPRLPVKALRLKLTASIIVLTVSFVLVQAVTAHGGVHSAGSSNATGAAGSAGIAGSGTVPAVAAGLLGLGTVAAAVFLWRRRQTDSR